MWTNVARWLIGGHQTQIASARPRVFLHVEKLEDRSLPSASSVLASLRDPALLALAKTEYTQGQRLDRGDMINLLRQTARDGNVTASELSDLKALVNHAGEMGMDSYVQALSNDVLAYNLANKTFQGQTLLPGGQLSAGLTGSELNKLIDKWFLGNDVPVAQNDYGLTYRYQLVKGTLFGAQGPSYLDVKQGYLGDCYYLAALGETAARSPQAVRDMFLDNGDGTYTVRFFQQVAGKQVESFVTVNRAVPVDGYGRFIFANMGQSVGAGNNVLWVSLAEKAYAQLAEQGWSRSGYAPPGNNYALLIGGSGFQPMQQIVGTSTDFHAVHSAAISSFFSDVTAGRLVTLGSNDFQPAGNHVIPDHEYYVTGYDAKTRTFTVVNPWGANLTDIGTLHLTAAEILASFADFDVAAIASPHAVWHLG